MARVIRGTSSGRVVPAELADARSEAEQVRENARADAARIRADALEGLREEAAAQARTELAAAWIALERERAKASLQSADDILALAVAIARRLLEAELTLAPERVREIAQSVLTRMPRAQQLRLRAHPGDAKSLAGLGATVIEDASITRGGCVVQSELGEVDARVETRIEALLAAVAKSGA